MTTPRPGGYRDELAAALSRIEELEAELRVRRRVFDADAAVIAIEKKRAALADAPRLYRLLAVRGVLGLIPLLLGLAWLFGPRGSFVPGGVVPAWLAIGGLASLQLVMASTVVAVMLRVRRRSWRRQLDELDQQVGEARERSLAVARARQSPGAEGPGVRVAASPVAASAQPVAPDASTADDEDDLLVDEAPGAVGGKRATRS